MSKTAAMPEKKNGELLTWDTLIKEFNYELPRTGREKQYIEEDLFVVIQEKIKGHANIPNTPGRWNFKFGERFINEGIELNTITIANGPENKVVAIINCDHPSFKESNCRIGKIGTRYEAGGKALGEKFLSCFNKQYGKPPGTVSRFLCTLSKIQASGAIKGLVYLIEIKQVLKPEEPEQNTDID